MDCPCGSGLRYDACCGRYLDQGETSRFVREAGRWFYVDGDAS